MTTDVNTIMTIPILATIIRVLWTVAERAHAVRHKVNIDGQWDKSSLRIWMAADLMIPFGIIIGFTNIGHIQTGARLLGLCGIALMLLGICVRWIAIHTLGKYFTRRVTILPDHSLVQTGLYKYLRHPSYSGFLIGDLGLALTFSNWLSFIIIFIPTFAAAFYRMYVEEKALEHAFGNEYIDYCRTTHRLIPKVY
jgi:protein-S-isoprenylcysteine O-methyltransferase Ste14